MTVLTQEETEREVFDSIRRILSLLKNNGARIEISSDNVFVICPNGRRAAGCNKLKEKLRDKVAELGLSREDLRKIAKPFSTASKPKKKRKIFFCF